MGIKLWKLPEVDSGELDRLADATGLPRLVCGVLAARGMHDNDEILQFVREDAELDDPFLLADMDKAVQRIQEALEDGERIAVFGDYDCDGITSTALLTSYFQAVGADVIYYVPDRGTEGYGLNRDAITMLQGQHVDLIITVDNGISAHGEVAHAAELGIDVIVTDHHTPRETLPDAVAVVNPHRGDCPSRFKDLAGVGVAFKLICALEGAQGDELLEYYSDLVAIGTVADIVPLTGENRTIVRHGLARLRETEHPGVAALIQVSGLADRPLTSEAISYGIAPRINAAGRMGVADDVIELLLTDDRDYAAEAAEQLNEQNLLRKATEDQIVGEIEQTLAADPRILKERLLLIAGQGWHHGVVGIAAAKMVERYQKPCILFSIEGGEARGSGRSVAGFSLIEAIAACSDRLTRYGGHAMAAGLTLPEGELDDFNRELLSWTQAHYDVMPVPALAADCALSGRELTVEGIGALSMLEPFGAGNEPPLFYLRGLVIDGVFPTADQKHIRIRFQSEQGCFYAVWFGMTAKAFPYRTGEAVDVMARISAGEYNGKAQLSVKIADLRPGGLPQESLALSREYHSRYLRGEALPPDQSGEIIPSRDEVGIVYKFLRQAKNFTFGEDALYLRLMATGISYCKVRLAVEVLTEMGFVQRDGDALRIVPDAPRSDLGNSTVLTGLMAAMGC